MTPPTRGYTVPMAKRFIDRIRGRSDVMTVLGILLAVGGFVVLTRVILPALGGAPC